MKNEHNNNDGERVLQRAAVPEGNAADDGPSGEDMAAINTLAPGQIGPDDVYVRSMYLCSDQVCPADWGRFTGHALEEICTLVVGRAVLRGHDRSSLPLARFFRAEVVRREDEMNPVTGEPANWVRAWFYWLRGTTGARDLLLNIDGGVYREVSISWRYRGARCSVCGDDIRSCDHTPGRTYDGARCHFVVDEVLDVLEGSLVYRGAESRASLAGARSSVRTVTTTNPHPSGKGSDGWQDFPACLSLLPRTIRRVIVSGENIEREVGALQDLGLWVRVAGGGGGPGDHLADPWEPSDGERVDLWVVKSRFRHDGTVSLPASAGPSESTAGYPSGSPEPSMGTVEFPEGATESGRGIPVSPNGVPRAERILLRFAGDDGERSRAERRAIRQLQRMGYPTMQRRRDAGGLSVLAERQGS